MLDKLKKSDVQRDPDEKERLTKKAARLEKNLLDLESVCSAPEPTFEDDAIVGDDCKAADSLGQEGTSRTTVAATNSDSVKSEQDAEASATPFRNRRRLQ